MKLLKNNGQSRAITISTERTYVYMTKAIKGRFKQCLVMVAMDRGDDGKDMEFKKFNLAPDEKMFSYFKKDQGKGKEWQVDKTRGSERSPGREIVHVGFSKVVTHYPHIIGKTIGLSAYDEREYNVLHQQILQVENDIDAQRLFDDYGFLDVVDEKGIVIVQNRWKKDREVAEARAAKSEVDRVDISKLPKLYEEVPWEEHRFSETKGDRRVEGMIRDQRMKEKEEGDVGGKVE